MFRASLRAVLSVLSVVAISGFASAGVVIDFESTPDGDFQSYTESGVTFTATDGLFLTSTGYGNTPNGTRGIASTSFPLATLRADIAGGATMVSVDLGDYDADADTLFLQVYDSANNLVGSTTAFIDDTFVGMVTLSVSANGIAYAIFGATDPALVGSSAYADNFTFEPAVVSSVPEPSTFALAGLAGIGGLVAVARRRKSKVG